ncbi:MAG: hypothetical protein IKJ99_07785 [Oscillospiraceae bacterium]|nr:hypothetical protein [Oscillospiraceae bacterium]
MKRLILLILILLLLTGCGLETAPDETVAPPNESQIDWVSEYGRSWDKEGHLMEVPLNIPGGIHYSMSAELDGDLLLWSVDSHFLDPVYLELCVVELDDGTVTAQEGIPMTGYVSPQVLGDKLYLCDSQGGTIIELDKNLQETNRWEQEYEFGTWYMDANETLYCQDMDLRFISIDLATGKRRELFPGCGEVMIYGYQSGNLTLEYYEENSGAPSYAGLNLHTGELTHNEVSFGYDSVQIVGDLCLSSKYNEHYSYRLSTPGSETIEIEAPTYYLQPLEDGNILATTEDSTTQYLFNGEGKAIASCVLSENGSYYGMLPIWSEVHSGYFQMVSGYDDNIRLLFWDISKGTDVEDLTFSPIPAPSEEELALQTRCGELSDKYGVTILCGNQCETEFNDFEASTVTDYNRIVDALDLLENALGDYPEDFFRQIRHDSIRTIQIQLVSDLIATGGTRSGDGYAAFTEEMWDHYLIVADIDDMDLQCYYHEFSHVIDSFLQWDAWQREDALYSETGWLDLNPKWFDGYSYDYSVLQEMDDNTSFIDSYSMISPTEDRARVMEYAMSEYGNWIFEDAPILQEKLSYYCRCIRDAFDTTGWPEKLLWEQYLNA